MSDIRNRIAASFALQGLMATLGAELEDVSDGEVRIAMPSSAKISQQQGFAHGGAITSILDSACGYAALTKAPPGWEVVTAEFKINLMRPAVGERFVATGRVVNAGRSLTVCTGEVAALSGATRKTIAVMQATIANVAPRA